MISYHTVRDDMPDCPMANQRTVPDAFNTLVQFQFGYGGQVKDVVIGNDTATLVVHTPVLGHSDHVTFSGPRDEMQLLLDAAHCHLQLMGRDGRPILDAAMDQVMQTTRKTLLVINLFNMVAGAALAKAICLMLLGVEEPQQLKRLSTLSVEDLCYMAILAHEGNALNDILALVA